MQEFQSKTLKEEWEKHQKAILMSSNERLAKDEEKRVELEKKIEEWKQTNDTIQVKINETIDSYRARFDDAQVQIQYDTTQLLLKQNNANSGNTKVGISLISSFFLIKIISLMFSRLFVLSGFPFKNNNFIEVGQYKYTILCGNSCQSCQLFGE